MGPQPHPHHGPLQKSVVPYVNASLQSEVTWTVPAHRAKLSGDPHASAVGRNAVKEGKATISIGTCRLEQDTPTAHGKVAIR
jgi:hypothetical protein